MMSFADKVQQAIEQVQNSATTERGQEFLRVLTELAEGLTRSGVVARIDTSRDPRRRTLYLHPQHRPAGGSPMLSFRIDDDTIVISGADTTTLHTAGELEDWLLEYVKQPAFVESLDILRERASRSEEARLRVDARKAFARGDVLVLVSAADQKRLDDAAPGETLVLFVDRLEFPGNATFTKDASYAVLDSAGIQAKVTEATVEGAQMKLSVVKV